MGGVRQQLMAAVLVAVALMATAAEGYITQKTWGAIRRANRAGPFVGLVVPNTYEMVPVLESPSFVASKSIPNMDIQGRRFRFGTIEGQSVVIVMTGLSMLNAGLTTQMLLSLFRVKGIVHWGIAGNANEDLQIGDVTIPEYWAHVSLWNWQGMELPACVNATTCLPRAPRVTRVSKGCSANVFLDNAEYRQFLRKQFECTPVEMESAAVALVAHTQGVPFLTIRSLSYLAGGGSALGNEASTFIDIAAKNAVEVMLKFVPLLGKGGDEMEDGAAADIFFMMAKGLAKQREDFRARLASRKRARELASCRAARTPAATHHPFLGFCGVDAGGNWRGVPGGSVEAGSG
ncbi:unnamed protein product [Triticum turgidum subsp. durum]|uniref:Nucleoside phosphorylase domain-containing protein n=1 Tax=Triticum turgidum subsp. durum TaxID=4567 RepID=A0A9R0RFR5_TRITD|nr:unnamed protein product [Triticum turgidum subsp. durum]